MRKYKKQKIIILSFLIPAIIYTFIFYINGLLTNKTIITGDMRIQYYPLFTYLKGVFNLDNSIFYSFSKGLGGTMYGTIFYYLSSPLNLLMLIINKQNIPNFITYLIIFKLSLCGLTMYLYMRRKFKTDSILLLAFSLCYSFMGYNLNYFINIMWLDVIILAPLVLIGLDRIIENKSPLMYIITLFISIFSNYYISYMLCIFCVLYFIYEILLKYNIKEDKKIIKEIIKNFLISSILTGLICSFFIIPCIFEMLNYGRNIEINQIFTHDLNIFNLITKTYIGSLNLNDTLNYTSINLYTSIIIMPLIFFYLFNRNINKKEKKLTILFIIIMLIPCFIGVFNYIWHLFTIPSFYSYRYSFLICLFLIRIGYESYKKIDLKIKEILLYLTFYLINSLYLIIITYYSNYYSFLNYKLIWLTTLILVIYMFILYKKPKNKNVLIISLMIIESFLNIFIIFNHSSFEDRSVIENKYEGIINKYKEKRLEINNTYNSAFIYNYEGINTFLSTTNYKTLDFLLKAGLNFDEYNNLYINDMQSILVDDMIGLKNVITDEKRNFKNLNKKEELKDQNIYENKDALSIGYIIKNECNDLKFGFPYDERIFNCIFNIDEKIYKKPKVIEETDNRITYQTKKDTIYYINTKETSEKKYEESLNNVIYNIDNYYMLKSKEEKLEIQFGEGEKENFEIYYFDYKKYDEIIKNLKIEQLDYKIDKDRLYGNIKTNGGLLMITIPYEKGYKIYVDNKPVKYKKVLNTFIGVDLESGEHKISVQYEQPGLKIGVIVSLTSLLLMTIYIRKEGKK